MLYTTNLCAAVSFQLHVKVSTAFSLLCSCVAKETDRPSEDDVNRIDRNKLLEQNVHAQRNKLRYTLI